MLFSHTSPLSCIQNNCTELHHYSRRNTITENNRSFSTRLVNKVELLKPVKMQKYMKLLKDPPCTAVFQECSFRNAKAHRETTCTQNLEHIFAASDHLPLPPAPTPETQAVTFIPFLTHHQAPRNAQEISYKTAFFPCVNSNVTRTKKKTCRRQLNLQ